MSETLSVKLSPELADAVERVARERGVTPAEFVAYAAADKVGEVESAAAYFRRRASRARSGDALRFFQRRGGEPPIADDRLD